MIFLDIPCQNLLFNRTIWILHVFAGVTETIRVDVRMFKGVGGVSVTAFIELEDMLDATQLCSVVYARK